MRMLHSSYSASYSTFYHADRVSEDVFTIREALRIYFSILFGVGVFVLAFYYLHPQMPY